MQTLTCGRCSHEWIPRMDPEKIKCCPKCKNHNWRFAKIGGDKDERKSAEHWKS
jgi:Zn finger protein HypA/HybF involved in hydrogenase expression